MLGGAPSVAPRAVARWRASLLSFLLAGMLFGPLACAPPSPPASGAPAAARAADGASPPARHRRPPNPRPRAPPIRVRYAYTAIAGSMAPMWVAYDLGLYAKHGVEPELTYAPSTQTIQAVLSGTPTSG